MFYYEFLVAQKYAYKTYIYSSVNQLSVGQLVNLEYGKKKAYGVCFKKANQESVSKLKNVKNIFEQFNYIFSDNLLKFFHFCAEYNLVSIGSILEMSIPDVSLNNIPLDLLYKVDEKITEKIGRSSFLLDNGVASLDQLLKAKYKSAGISKLEKFVCSDFYGKYINNGVNFSQDQLESIQKLESIESGKVCLLQGVTGSGKTLVALMGIKKALEAGQKVLIITPEVALGKAWALTIEKFFSQYSCFYNYQVSKLYKSAVFKWANSDNPGIIIGARSALFLPYKNLGAIVIDEEHSVSLKQERYPRYHARDMAIIRAYYEKARCVLLSATPSLETKYNVELGKYEFSQLKRAPKHGSAEFVFTKQEKEPLSPKILEEMTKAFEKKQQVLLFLNRKGYAPYCYCNNCNKPLVCNGCDFPKIFYSNYNVSCHKCGSIDSLPSKCPICKQSTTWRFHGIGIERLEEFVKMQFSDYKFEVVTSDTKEIDNYIESFNEGEIDCLIATQVLAQGHDFKNISLAVIVDGDSGLNSPDFRSSERMLQLWQQIRGRSARHEIPGKLIVQANSDESKFIQLFNLDDPYSELMQERKMGNWPPFTRCAFIIIKSKKYDLAKEYLKSKVFFTLKDQSDSNGIEFYGPLYVGKQNFVHEWRFLIKASRNKKLYLIMQDLIKNLKKEKQITLEYEIDPYSFV